MVANLLVRRRRSTARLLCLVRSQVASFFTERPPPPPPPLPEPSIPRRGRGGRTARTNHEIWCRPIERQEETASRYSYQQRLLSFRKRFLAISFKEHLVKHCSHTKIQWDAVRKFEVAFFLIGFTLAEEAEHYYNQTVEFRDKKKLPKRYQATLLEEVDMSKEELRVEYRRYFTDEVMREIEEDIMKRINENIVKAKERKVKEEMVAMGDPGMATPC